MWAAMGPFHRLVRRLLATLAGRLVLGPPYMMWRASCRFLGAVRDGNMIQLRRWLNHVPCVALVLVWVMGVCHIPLWQYLLLYVYPGLSLTLLRSFAEHRAAASVGERIVTMQTNPLMALLFTNNHTARPASCRAGHPLAPAPRPLSVYARPSSTPPTRAISSPGYRQLFRRYLFRAKEPPVHPLAGQGFPL